MINLENSSSEDDDSGEMPELIDLYKCKMCNKPSTYKCCMVIYCSKECQKNDWENHKKDCKKIKIKVIMDSKLLLKDQFNSTDTIQNIKQKIQDSQQIRLDQPLLFFDNKVLQDDKTLEYYNIKSNSELTLKQKIPEKFVYMPANNVTIKIIRSGETFRIQVNPTNTIENIKQKIHNVISVLPPDRQRLVFEGKILEDSKTLQDYNVGNGYILNLIF